MAPIDFGDSPGTVDLDELVQPGRVHRRVYVDPWVFEQELRRVFGRTWVYVAHESEIPAPGDFKTAAIGRQPVIVTRDQEGRLHVMYNRCRHRGATVCQDASGNARFFRCEYHGWTYDISGALNGIPMRDGYGPAFQPASYGLLQAARVDTYRGFVFASANPDVPALAEHLANAAAYVDAFVDSSPQGEIIARSGAHNIAYSGNWKLQVENGIDGYHAPHVHQTYFGIRRQRGEVGASSGAPAGSSSLVKALGNGHTVLDRRGAVGEAFCDELAKLPAGARYLEEMERRFGLKRARELLTGVIDIGFNLTVYPNLHIQSAGGCQIRQIRPVTVDRTLVSVQPLERKGLPRELNEIALRYYEEFFGPAGHGSPDDYEIFNRIQEGLQVEADEWVLMERGLEREWPEGSSIVSYSSDETPQRSQYAQWKRLMAGDGPVVSPEAGAKQLSKETG